LDFDFITALLDFAAAGCLADFEPEPPAPAPLVELLVGLEVGRMVVVGAVVGVAVLQNTSSPGISWQIVFLIHSNPSLTRAKTSGRPVMNWWRITSFRGIFQLDVF